MSRILLNGGNGALGVYLTQELQKLGHDIDVLCLEEGLLKQSNIRYLRHDGKDFSYLKELMRNDYDAIVDFMVYPTIGEFVPYADLYLDNTKHYIFTSTYRVYGSEYPITEKSPRLWDLLRAGKLPEDFVEDYEYSIYKAKCEDYLLSGKKRNWSIIRPTITYSKARFQLTVLEAGTLIHRMRANKTVVLPEGAMDCEGTLSWAGDFGICVSKLVLNENAFGEAYTIGTSEHHTWREIAEIYKKIGGLEYITVDDDTFVNEIFGGSTATAQQLKYDRCYNRVIDNEKILKATNRKASDFMPLEQGLTMELENYDNAIYNVCADERMDRLLEKICGGRK